jgi:hypothetical protein
MKQKYIYDRNGSVKAVIYEDDSTATVIALGKGAIGTVFKSDVFPHIALYGSDIVGSADDVDSAAGLILEEDARRNLNKKR